MTPEEAYAVWAPADSPWSPWVKPLLFSSVAEWTPRPDEPPVAPPDAPWLTRPDAAAAYVVDLPGPEGVRWGLALARHGWRPVPLYNAAPGESRVELPHPTAAPLLDPATGLPLIDAADFDDPLVDVWSIVRAMRHATAALQQAPPSPDAPPAFLLDANRRFGSGPALPGRFDNRSVSLPTDFPSALFLKSRGIRHVVLVFESPQEDLAHTLAAWQEAGLPILVARPSEQTAPRPTQILLPSGFRLMWYRFLATIGLRRNPLGGFGGTIPVPSAG